MSEKTEQELRELADLHKNGAPFEAFPDGATWADLEDALARDDEETPDAV